MKFKSFALQIKDLSDEGTFEGYGSVFGNVDSYGEKVMPGAFTGSLARHRREGSAVVMLWQHDPDQPIGVWEDLAEDAKGLWGKGRLIMDVQKAREVHALMKAKALGGLSIGYREIKVTPDGNVRNLDELDLREISPVTFPANRRARISSVKSIGLLSDIAQRLADGSPAPASEFEDALREAGFSKSISTAIASHGYVKVARGEPEAKKASDEAARFLALLAAN